MNMGAHWQRRPCTILPPPPRSAVATPVTAAVHIPNGSPASVVPMKKRRLWALDDENDENDENQPLGSDSSALRTMLRNTHTHELVVEVDQDEKYQV